MFCWAEAENSIKMRGGKNLPLAQSRRSRCSGSLPLACLLHQNWSPWNMTVPKKQKDTKHSWKKSNSKYKPHWFLKREEKIKKSRFLKKMKKKRIKQPKSWIFSTKPAPEKMVPSWNPKLCQLGNLTGVSTFWLQKCFQSLVKIDDWPHLDYIYLKGSFGAQATWARPLWPPLDSICLCVSMFDQVVIIFRGLRIW